MSVVSKIKVHPQHCALWLDTQRESEQCLKRSQVAVPWSDSNSDYQLLHHGNVCKCVCAYDNMSFSLSSVCSWPHSCRFLYGSTAQTWKDRPDNFKKDLQPLWMKSLHTTRFSIAMAGVTPTRDTKEMPASQFGEHLEEKHLTFLCLSHCFHLNRTGAPGNWWTPPPGLQCPPTAMKDMPTVPDERALHL